jgi:uncharacterized membrane protein
MKKQSIDFTAIILFVISLLILAIGVLLPSSNTSVAIIGALIIMALVIFDINAPKIAKLSKDNPKVKTIRNLNRLTAFIFSLISLFVLLSPAYDFSTLENNKLIISGVISIFMMVFGNVSPKIPFNRYLGLRLPWTIRDEETWRVAHKILGYLSFPLAILQFTLAFFFPLERAIGACIILWITIPGLYSLWFFYKKFKVTKAS